MYKIKDLSKELMQVLHRYDVRGVCIVVDDNKESIHSVSNMEGDESVNLIKSLAENFTVLSKDSFVLEDMKPVIDLKDPNIN